MSTTPLAKRRKTQPHPQPRPSAAHHLSTLLPSHPHSAPGTLLPTIGAGGAEADAEVGREGKGKGRYSERKAAVGSGLAQPTEADLPDLAQELELGVDLAEPSLGDLAALPAPSDPAPAPALQSPRSKAGAGALPIPAGSLSLILAQALHSADMGLLESCLQHSRPALLRTSVQRLPPRLALALLDACVERLGRGPRGQKGGAAAASAGRGAALVLWVREVLVCHTAYLLTIPDVVTRLSALYTVLASRLALHPRLLTLAGRLDLVLAQLDLRDSTSASASASALPPPHALPSAHAQPHGQGQGQGQGGRGGKKARDAKGRKYVEGESEEEERKAAELGVERAEEEGSVEDVELGGSEDEEEDNDDDEEEEEEEEEEEDVEMEDVDAEEEDVEGDDDDDDDEEEEEEEDEEGTEEDEGVPKPNGFLHEADEDEDEESE